MFGGRLPKSKCEILIPSRCFPFDRRERAGRGGRTQLLLFLDDLAPSLFGKPLLSR
jgi:hypothetical protein